MFENERRDLAHVPRWGIVRTIRTQSVAEHSYYVACYGLEVARLINWPKCVEPLAEEGQDRYLLALYLLRHDETETITGDVPGPIKRLSGMDMSNLDSVFATRYGKAPYSTKTMKNICKVADLMDECMYLAGEIRGGNMAVTDVFRNSKTRLACAIIKLRDDAQLDDNVAHNLINTINRAIDAEHTYNKDQSGFERI